MPGREGSAKLDQGLPELLKHGINSVRDGRVTFGPGEKVCEAGNDAGIGISLDLLEGAGKNPQMTASEDLGTF